MGKGKANYQEVYKDLIKYKVISTDGNSLNSNISSDHDLRQFMRDGMDNHFSEALYQELRETDSYKQEVSENARVREVEIERESRTLPVTIPAKQGVTQTKVPMWSKGSYAGKPKAGSKVEVFSKSGIKEYAKVRYVNVNGKRQVRLQGQNTGRFYSLKKNLYGG